TNKQLRRGVHRSVAQLKTAIREFIAAHHANAKPFVWTKSADEILATIARFAQRTLAFQTAPLIARTTRTGHTTRSGLRLRLALPTRAASNPTRPSKKQI